MILPAMGMVSDIIACFARKPLFGYKPMVYSIAGIAGLGFIVWGHHMFISGMNPALGMTFMVSTMMIALPSAIKTFNWLGTIWGGKIQFTTPMLFALSFVSMFIIGGLSGIFMAATPVDIFIHDTYFIVAHFHYVLFAGTAMGVFGAIYFWFPKMFGRMMNEPWGKVHFFLTFIFLNGTFFPMHILGVVGFPRRLADPYHYQTFHHLQPLNQFMTCCAIGMVAVADHLRAQLHLQHVLRAQGRPQSVARQRPGMAGPQPAGPRQLRFPAGRLPRPVRIRLAGSRHRLLSANAAAAGAATADRAPSHPRTQPVGPLTFVASVELACVAMSDVKHHTAATRKPLAASLGRGAGLRDVSADLGRRAGDDATTPAWPCPIGRTPTATTCFSYPWQTWVYGPWDLFIEHGHRLLGSLVGHADDRVLDRRPGGASVGRWCAGWRVAALAAVILSRRAGRHARDCSTRCNWPRFTAASARRFSPSPWPWPRSPRGAGSSRPSSARRRLARQGSNALAVLTTLLAYCQLVLGSQLRHLPAGAQPGDFRIALVFHLVMAAALAGAHRSCLAARVFRSAARPTVGSTSGRGGCCC